MSLRPPHQPHSGQRGFTLFEVLIALVVLSIGLLGLAGLQAIGMRDNNRAYARTQASSQLYDLADRMRANLSGVASGDYDNLGQSGTIPANPGCITTGCTPAQMATYDAYAWNTENRTLLPQGFGTVKTLGNNVYQITVQWNDGVSKGTGTQVVHTVSVNVLL